MPAIATHIAKHSARSPLAALLIFWLVASAFFASSPSLHHWLHEDADHETHQCAITLVEKQQLLAAACGPVLVNSNLGFAKELSLHNSPDLPLATYNYSISRAPPA